jgi:hypothetical protein
MLVQLVQLVATKFDLQLTWPAPAAQRFRPPDTVISGAARQQSCP